MTTRTHNRTLQGRARILAAVGVTSLALVAASPASAIYRDYEPSSDEPPVTKRTANSDDTAKAGCSVTLSTGQTIVYSHGYSFSVQNKATGKTHTFTCQDGKWVETVDFTSGTTDEHYQADDAYVDGSGALVLVNPHEENTYSTDGGYYAQP